MDYRIEIKLRNAKNGVVDYGYIGDQSQIPELLRSALYRVEANKDDEVLSVSLSPIR